MQYQPSARTVAGELQKTFSAILRHRIAVTSAGRTDSGVHATGQVVSFKTQAAFPFDRLAIAANSSLPCDVRIRAAEIVPDEFSARFSASQRTYVYAIYNSPNPSPLLSRYAYHVWNDLDADVMARAAKPLIGTHDFRSFCGMLPQSGPTVRTVTLLRIERKERLIRIEIRADGFLHRMVRTIVGTLVDCATGRRDPASVDAILAARERAAAGRTAPAHGLYLAGVRYTDGFDSFCEPPIAAAFV
jgi:tRNA pseudouridine38-40 synthase